MDRVGRAGLASIIIPTFNRGELLKETLDSAVGQTYRPVEIIVVDDGSTDHTAALIEQWRGELPGDPGLSVRYIHQENGGVGSARNHGLIESRGEFIQFLDSDDVLHPRKLELQIACLVKFPESGYAFSEMARIEDSLQWSEIAVEQARLADSAEFYCSPKVLTMVGVYRRQTCCTAGPWSEDIHLGEDEEYALRALLSTEKLVYLPGYLCAFRDHTGPRLTDAQKHERGWYFALQAYDRMAEVAAADGRVNDQRFVEPLVKHLTDIIVMALETGANVLANTAIRICWKLPVKPMRRARLVVYWFLNLMPTGFFLNLWRVWIKFRYYALEIPRREFCRIRDGWKLEKRGA